MIIFSFFPTYTWCKLDAINNSTDHNEIDAFTNNALSAPYGAHLNSQSPCLITLFGSLLVVGVGGSAKIDN